MQGLALRFYVDIKSLLVTGLIAAFAGCSTLPRAVEREPSYAISQAQSTGLSQLFAEEIVEHGSKSGFLPLIAGRDAYNARIALIGLAENTLDLQYYLWAGDLTGRAMLYEVLAAAERGVRVRLLLDDIHTDDGLSFAAVDAHPKIEVRVFNPFGWRGPRLLSWLVDGARLNRRMHNKTLIADNTLSVTGGRNIGDHYFAIDPHSNFRDLDLLAVGPATHAISLSFDDYWNSEWAYPIDAVDGEAGDVDPQNVLKLLDAWIVSQAHFPFMRKPEPGQLRNLLDGFRKDLKWGNAQVLYDSPKKIAAEDSSGVAAFVFDSSHRVDEELLMEVSYLIPGDRGVQQLRELVERGVSVKVLTNSLATNDITAAHSGYLNYRKALLRAGVEIHELRPDAAAEQERRTLLASRSLAHLHTKAFVYDRNRVFVGSLNIDPRSISLNTEMGILVESPALAAEIRRLIEEGMQPENSYELFFTEEGVLWYVEGPEQEQMLGVDPDTGAWERFLARILSWLPIENQL